MNVEVQRADDDDHLRRARFNGASITVKDSNPGDDFADVVDVSVIYISKFDIFKGESPIYHIDKVVRETNKVIDDGSAEIFVNTKNKDGSLVSELMECFTQKEVNNPKFPKLSNRVKYLKTTEGGVSAVSEVMERYQAKAVREAEIKKIIDVGCEFSIPKANIIDKIIREYELSEIEANEKYDMYAPETINSVTGQ